MSKQQKSKRFNPAKIKTGELSNPYVTISCLVGSVIITPSEREKLYKDYGIEITKLMKKISPRFGT